MRKVLLLFCILSITVCAKAQMFGKHWVEGAYYDADGKKTTGLIAWTAPKVSLIGGKGDDIFFKADEKSDKIKISSALLKSFTMQRDTGKADSFVVSNNSVLEKKPFLLVLIDHETKLYASAVKRQTATMPGAGVGMPVAGLMMTGGVSVSIKYDKMTYYYGITPDSLVELDRKNFIETMTSIMADKPEAVKRIKNKQLKLADIVDLLYFYKYDIMPPAAAPDPFSGSDH